MLKEPSKATLRRYGLTIEKWRAIAKSQDGVCFVCQKLPSTARLCIDHEHVKGWKKMPDAKRARYVRGLLCWVCNHYYLGRGITLEKARRVVEYLERYIHHQTESL